MWQHQTLLMDPEHAVRGFKRVANPIMDSHFAPTPKVTTIEIPTARAGYAMIADKVPFSVVPGNHDHDAMWTDANHPPAAVFKDMSSLGVLHAGGLDNFRSLFGADQPFFKGKPWYVASHDGGADSAQLFDRRRLYVPAHRPAVRRARFLAGMGREDYRRASRPADDHLDPRLPRQRRPPRAQPDHRQPCSRS
jgi:hypothetical protein